MRTGPVCLVSSVSIALSLAASLTAQSVAALTARAEKLGFRTGVVVRDLATGADLYRHRSQETFLPASNQKLLTSAAALWGLGTDYRFRTVFRVRAGWLEVVAGGDPNWVHGSENDAEKVFRRVAERLRGEDITHLRGVRLVRGSFTGPIRPAGWPQDQYDRDYCAPTGGLVLDASLFRARIAPSGGRVAVTMIAPPFDGGFRGAIKLSAKKRAGHWLSHKGETFRAHGSIYRKARAKVVEGVCQAPEWLFGASLRAVLRRSGMGFDAAAPAVDADVYTHTSGLGPALVQVLRKSSNFHAEQLLRVLGKEKGSGGSFVGGLAAVRDVLGARVPWPQSMVNTDGSGLSRGNRVTPAYLVAILVALSQSACAGDFVAALPQGGKSGTLRKRFRGKGQSAAGQATRAKTGYIRGVRALSGFVQRPDRSVRVFSILMNHRKGTSTAGTKAIQDQMVTAIYRGNL